MSSGPTNTNMIEWVNVKTLREHPFSMGIYGSDDHSDLTVSIREHGVLTPLVIQGNVVISGHRRLRGAIDAGLEVVPCIQRRYTSTIDEQEAILEHNRSRNKTLLQLYREGKALEDIERAKARQRQVQGGKEKVVQNSAQPVAKPKTRNLVARALGIGSGEQWRRLDFVGRHNMKLLDERKSDKLSINRAYLLSKHQKVVEHPIQSLPTEKAIESEIIRYGPFEERAEEIPDNSVALILTHQMLDTACVDQWEKLSSVASRVLVEGGFLIAYVSKRYIAEILWALKQHLQYFWMISFRLSDSDRWARQPLNVITDWIPIIIFSKGEPHNIEIRIWRDSLITQCEQKCDKRSCVSSARYLIRQFSADGTTVVDPYAHRGEFLLAACMEGRHAYGYESNLNNYHIAKQVLSSLGNMGNKDTRQCPRVGCGGRLFREGAELFCVKCGYRTEIAVMPTISLKNLSYG